MNEWVAAAIAVVAGFVVGTIASRIVLAVLSRSKRSAIRESAAPIAGLVLATGVIIGLLVALGFVSPDDLDELGSDAIAFFPKLIAAMIILIGGIVASSFAAQAVAKSLAGTGSAARFAPVITKYTIIGGAAIIAAAQAGVDTAVVNIGVAALLFGVAASLALLTGLGGRQVAGEIAAGRAWRRSLETGDHISADGVAGTSIDGVVVEVHPTAVELDSTGTTVFIPNSKLMEAVVERRRPGPADAEAAIDVT